MDWAPKVANYQKCIWDGRVVDMQSAVSLTELPPCVDLCVESPGVALSYNTFCSRSIDYQGQSQTSFDVRWSCDSVDDINVPGCEWSTDETADLTLAGYMEILVILMAQSLSLPPNDVHCGLLWFGPSAGFETISGMFNLRVDESFWTTVFDETFPYISFSTQQTTGTYDMFMGCRIDSYRLQEGDVHVPLANVLVDLGLDLIGSIQYKTKTTQHLSGVTDTDYSLKYDLGCCGWNTQLITTTTTSSTESPITTTTIATTTTTTPVSSSTSSVSWVNSSTTHPSTDGGKKATMSAEDETTRNIILISVFVSTGVLTIVFMLVVYIYRRRRLAVFDSQVRQSDSPYVQTPAHSERAMSVDGVVKDVDKKSVSSISDPFDFLINAEKTQRMQKQRSQEFRDKQEYMKTKRTRRKSEESISDNEMEAPKIPEERAIMKTLTETIYSSDDAKRDIYNDLLLKWHPDKRRDDPKLSTRVFQFIQSRKKWYLHASKTH